jgi:hypothetical protein
MAPPINTTKNIIEINVLSLKKMICSIALKNQNIEMSNSSDRPRFDEIISWAKRIDIKANIKNTNVKQRFNTCITPRLIKLSFANSSFHLNNFQKKR